MSRGLGDVYKRQLLCLVFSYIEISLEIFKENRRMNFFFLFGKKKIEKKSCGVSLNILPLHRNCHNSSVGRAFHS